MATKLFLRNTQNNGIGPSYFDMVTTAGSASDTAVVNTVASGTEIQWTKTAGGAVAQWISGRTPAGGFSLTTTDISIWAHESDMLANTGGRYRVFIRTAAGVETEIAGGPFNDGVEFGTAATEMLWAGNVTDQVFAENDRILLKVYITGVGTMGGPFAATLTFNAANAATGDSFFNIAETVTFKAEDPFAQRDWRLPYRAPARAETWLGLASGGLREPVAATAPFAQRDWPLPYQPRRLTDSWTQRPINLLDVVAEVVPFKTTDWPVPRTTAFPAALRTSTSAASPETPVKTHDWPLPRSAVYPNSLRTSTSGAPSETPVRPADFPTPRAASRRLPDSWTQQPSSFLEAVAEVVPFHQTDWPVPYRRAYQPSSRSSGRPSFTAVDVVPRHPLVWQRPPVPYLLRTWLNPGITTEAVVEALPFNQFDWPLPRSARRRTDEGTQASSIALLSLVAEAVPFHQTDWPAARAAAFPADLRTWLNVTRAEPKPITAYHWPNPRASVFPSDLRTWTNATRRSETELKPFAVAPWANPTVAVWPVGLRTWTPGYQPLQTAPAVKPPVIPLWMLPRSAAYPVALRTLVNPLGAPLQPADAVAIDEFIIRSRRRGRR